MKSINKILIFSFLVSLTSCLDRYDPGLTNDKQRLVVEATLTSELEFQRVFLSYDAGYNSDENLFKFLVKKAKVSIEDDKGVFYLFEDEIAQANQIKTVEGYNYKSVNKFKADLSRSYRLNIETLEGNKYQSAFEKAVPVPQIEKVTTEFRELTPPNTLKGQYDVFLNIKDPAGVTNFYKWDTRHYKRINYCREWYIYGSGGSVTQAFIDECCQPCYEMIRSEDNYQLGNDKFIDGNTITRKYVASVPYSDNSPYFIQINQYSLTEAAYKFWNAVEQQSKNSGGLFDATPISIRGNIKSLGNSESEVLGYFGVSEVYKKNMYIDRTNASVTPLVRPDYSDFWNRTTTCWPCEETYKRSKTPPPGWIL